MYSRGVVGHQLNESINAHNTAQFLQYHQVERRRCCNAACSPRHGLLGSVHTQAQGLPVAHLPEFLVRLVRDGLRHEKQSF